MDKECCEFLLHEIAFYKDSIRPCCSFSIPENEKMPFISDFDGKIEDIEKYFKKRKEFIDQFLNGEKPVCYKNCKIYEPYNSINIDFKLTNLIISNFTKCSCNCIYCEHGVAETRQLLNKRKAYDIKPILIWLRKNNYIQSNCRMLICGGECSEYPDGELEFLIYFAKITDCKLLILSSGIIYSKAIENALKSSDTILKISVDSGTKKTYEKIKGVKAYDNVWNNIKKYIKYTQIAHNSNVELKYIIIPDINDNIKEINAFIQRVKEVNCSEIVLDVEHKFIAQNFNNEKIKKKLSFLLNYFFKRVDELNNKTYYTHISIEGVEDGILWSLVDEKYNYKKESC